MAAPNGTKWGSTANSKGRIGIYANVSSSATTTTVEISVYFWSKYAVNDSSNKYYYNSNATSATTLIGSRSIKTTTNGGSGWSTTNQVRIAGPSTYSYKRGTTNVTKSFAAKLTGVDWVGGTMTVTTSITVPKLASYTISFNANGGSGAPGSQTKWYGKTLTLSSTRPIRTGHSFRGWGLSSTTSTVSYSPGGSYTTNASDTLYAVWAPDTYQVQYNANGGSGAPGSQTKVYGQTLTLSSTRPTRANYNFLGWSASKTATSPTYSPGSSYTGNNHITLYAVWQLAYAKPRISGFKASRCNSDGTDNELGTYLKVSFNWSSDRTVTKIGGQYKRQGASQWSEMATTIPASGTSGSVADKIIDSGYSSDVTYFVRVYVSDSGGTGYSSEASISTPAYPIDIKAKGTGVAFGKVAEKAGCVETAWPIERKQNKGTSWYTGRNGAMIKQMYPSNDTALHTLATMKTETGSWEIGTVHDVLWFSHIKDEDYNSGNNRQDKAISSDILIKSYEYGGRVQGWNTLPLTSYFTAYSSLTTPKYIKIGSIVYLIGSVKPTSNFTSSSDSFHRLIGTLPSGYRPSIETGVLCQGSGRAVWFLRVGTDGRVGCERYRYNEAYQTVTTSNWLPFNISFPAI